MEGAQPSHFDPEAADPRHIRTPTALSTPTAYPGHIKRPESSQFDSRTFSPSSTRSSRYLTPPPLADHSYPFSFSLDHDSRSDEDVSTPQVLPSYFSPPPTVPRVHQPAPQVAKPDSTPTPAEISNASPAELLKLLHASLSKVSSLSLLLKESNMAAAHHKLQLQLLTIETVEATNRMHVENEMIRREVEVLRMGELSKQQKLDEILIGVERKTPTSYRELITRDLRTCQSHLKHEGQTLRKRLLQAKKLIVQQEEECLSLHEENGRLRKRIKENREHINRLNRATLDDASKLRQNQATTPRGKKLGISHGPPFRAYDESPHSNEDTFAALLLADQVLSQENASAPHTPTTPIKRNGVKLPKHGAKNSISSLPSTPIISLRSAASARCLDLLPPLNFASALGARSEPLVENLEEPRGQQSRDSTISASEPDSPGSRAESNENDKVPESHASGLATVMLRQSPSLKGKKCVSPAPKSSALLQSRLFGRLSKPRTNERAAKRKSGLETHERPYSKRHRKSEDRLGIGGWQAQ
ncbi:MAG: hypothetical protein M1829_000572 [Trizodia sp. TS-e1964]|nr:MAG: hypothetical protein M1829_000572 [Trizodia sp. TS-e1964]